MIDFENFTLNNQGVKELSEVLFTTAFKQNNVFNTATLMTGVENGAKVDFVDNMGHVGKAGRGCNPTYDEIGIHGDEKTWVLDDWTIAKSICYKVLEDTIAKFSLKGGTNRDDLQGSEFYDKILTPLMDKAIKEFIWRVVWFADKTAKTTDNSGVITAGTDLDLIKVTDGLWKKLFAIGSANSAQHTTIAANGQSTYALQKSSLRGAGVATGIVDAMLEAADPRIAYASDAQLMMSRSLYEALRRDYRDAYKQTIPFMEVADGVQLPSYDGTPIVVVPEWDINIDTFENNGSAWNLPHRAVYASPSNLLVGTKATDLFDQMTSKFDDRKRDNYFYAAGNVGTLVMEDALVQLAY